jgi:chromosome condensin MukBEF MukE localization factor
MINEIILCFVGCYSSLAYGYSSELIRANGFHFYPIGDRKSSFHHARSSLSFMDDVMPGILVYLYFHHHHHHSALIDTCMS